MGMFDAINASASGLTAERLRLDVISNNLANVNTTRTVEGGPYRRQLVVFEPRTQNTSFSGVLGQQMSLNSENLGVKVGGIVKDPSPFRQVYDPSHPDANRQGYVELPNINVVSEMVDMITASRAYEANVTAMNTAKSMALKALDIGK